MRYSSVQMRFSAIDIYPGQEICFRGTNYILGTRMPPTLRNGGVPFGGYSAQFELLCNGQRSGAAWFYFYTAFEGNAWAVLDELELSSSRKDGIAV